MWVQPTFPAMICIKQLGRLEYCEPGLLFKVLLPVASLSKKLAPVNPAVLTGECETALVVVFLHHTWALNLDLLQTTKAAELL